MKSKKNILLIAKTQYGIRKQESLDLLIDTKRVIEYVFKKPLKNEIIKE